jgi:hypothetical protein
MPAAAAASGEADRAAAVEAALARATPGRPAAEQPITVNVQVDGETVARAAAHASRDVAGRSFSPVPVY